MFVDWLVLNQLQSLENAKPNTIHLTDSQWKNAPMWTDWFAENKRLYESSLMVFNRL